MTDPAITPRRHRPDLDWEGLVRRLLLWCRHLGAPLEEAEDLVHDTLQGVIEDPEWFDADRGSLLTALRAVVRNRLVDRRRHQQVRHRAEPRLRLLSRAAPPPDVEAAAAEARACRHRFLAHLTAEERQLFAVWLQQRRQEHTAATAAASLGLSVAAYDNSKKRLRRRFQRLLAELELHPSDLLGPEEGR